MHARTDGHTQIHNLPGHINGAGVLSNAPVRTWISASPNRGNEVEGRSRERKRKTEEREKEADKAGVWCLAAEVLRHSEDPSPN